MDLSEALRDSNPRVRILNGALDLYAPHTGEQPFHDGFYYISADAFMDALFAAEPRVFEQFDYWNSHPYPMGAFRLPPWRQAYHFDYLNGVSSSAVRPPAGIYNRGINGYEWELWQLSRYGLSAPPVIITETGWRHNNSVDPTSSDHGDDYPAAEVAAIYLDLALRGNIEDYPNLDGLRIQNWTPWLKDERVRIVAPFALNGAPWKWGYSNWLQLDENGTILGTSPMYDLVRHYQASFSAR